MPRILLAALLSLLAAPAWSSPVTVADLVRFSRFGDPLALDWLGDQRAGPPGIFSPDGQHVAVVVRGGNPAQETNTASLLVYATETLLSDPERIELATFASANRYQPIAFVHWLDDNQTLVFAGTKGDEITQIYRANIRSREIRQLTHVEAQPIWYHVASSGRRLVMLFEDEPTRPEDDATCKRYGCRVDARSLYEAEAGGFSRIVSGDVLDLPSGRTRKLVGPESLDRRIDFCDPEFVGGISPDGRHAIRLCRFRERYLPEAWGDYAMNPRYREAMQTRNARAWRFGFMVDLETGKATPWTEAPSVLAFFSAPPIWIDGGEHVILPAAFEPLAGTSGKERTTRASAYSVQLLDPDTGGIVRIGRLDPSVAYVASASWNEGDQILTVQGQDAAKKPLPPAYFRRHGDRWSVAPAPGRAVDDAGHATRLAVEQSPNDRPVLFAIGADGRRRQLLDPNPWLDDRGLGRVEAIEWPATDGRIWVGGIYYPPDYRPGKRYPLVLQTHGFDAGKFSLDGAARNFPGQALAAHGILVLQVKENYGNTHTSPRLWANARAGYEGAIDHLDKLGLIDRNRVGTIGWSATGPTTAAMLTHSEYPIAAAAFTDTSVYGWWYYILGGGSESQHARFGATPFGEGMARWLGLSPPHNLHRVRTPLLMWGGGGVSGMWEWYAGLKQLDKPVELWNLPTGTHDIYQVSQRLKTNQRLVDWFRFWLKGEARAEVVPWGEETAASLESQYVRWREMRRQQDRILGTPRPPLLKWVATPVDDASDLEANRKSSVSAARHR